MSTAVLTVDAFTNDLDSIINHTKNAIENAKKHQSKLNSDIINLSGMSDPITRHLYNNICDIDNATYCEVGTWKGASFISAMYNNKTFGYVIDNWSEFDGPINEFNNNIDTYFSDKSNIQVYNRHCFDQISENDITKSINIYLFDGNHEYDSHKKAITHYNNFFSKYVIIIIDDFWGHITQATNDGISEMGLIVHYHEKIDRVVGESNDSGIYVCERTS